MQRYYVTQAGKQVGPWTVSEIVEQISQSKLAWTDYLYDESKKDWVLLLDHHDLVPHFRKMTAKAPAVLAPAAKSESAAPVVPLKAEKEWFVLKEQNKYGPFGYLELVKMLQEKNLYEYDWVWNSKFPSWKRVADCEEFSPDKVRSLYSKGLVDEEEVFFRRRHARAQYGASLIVHNNKKVWKADSLEISAGGCGILLEDSSFQPGQSLFLHFQPGDGVPPFNAICEIVNKTAGRGKEKRTKYGVKFTSINRQVQLAIKEYTDRAA